MAWPRGVFVGREAEFSELATAVDEAIEGQGRGFLVLGDAGIGKTRLASEVADHACDAGALVLWGRCWEAGGAPPYWPWTEIMRGAAEVQGSGVPAPLAALVPGPGTRATGDQPADASRARFELFEAMGSFLRGLASQRPVLVVIDDLHAADLPSLLLLEFLLGGAMRRARVAIVALARDHEFGRAEDLTEAALRVRRLARPVRLRGLGRDEVAALVEHRVAHRPSEAVLDAVNEATEGNPLFVEELAALIGRGRGETGFGRLPAGIRDTIRQRLAPFSDATLDVLRIGAVVGREFPLDLVERVGHNAGAGRRDAHAVAAGVDEAARGGLLDPVHSARYRFAHILVRDVLYDDLAATDRARLHAEVARSLEERHRADLDDHVDEIAHHFVEAATAGGADRAVEYLMRAGARADARLAYEAAAGHYERALDLLDGGAGAGAGDDRRCDVLLALGTAYARAGRTDRAKEAFRRAGRTARRLHDGERLGRAALGLSERVAFQQHDDEVIVCLDEALVALPDEAVAMRARLLGALARVLGYAGMRERMEAVGREAVAVARSLGDAGVLAEALTARQMMLWGPDRVEERLEAASELLAIAERCADRDRALEGHMSLMICQLEVADAREFDRSLAAYARLAEGLRQPRYRFVALARRAMRELMRGDFDAGRRLAEDARRLGNECEEPDAEVVFHGVWALPSRDVDVDVDVEGFFVEFSSRHTSAGSRALLALLAADRGDHAAARSDLAALAAGMGDLPKDMDWLLCLSLAGEVAHALGDQATAATLYALLSPYGSRCALLAGAVGFAGSVAHYLGLLAATLGRLEECEGHFSAAAARHHAMGARPWLVRTWFEHGRVLAARPEPAVRARGQALLAQARAGAEELGMTALLRCMSDDGAPPEPRADVAVLRRAADSEWVLRYGPSEFRLADTKGLRHLAVLLARPGREVHVLDLAAAGEGTARPHGDAGAVLDGPAKAAYRRRLEELRDDLAQAEAWADGERASRAKAEMEMIAGELASAVGLGGRDRRAASSSDRARVSVRKAIVRALREIDSLEPALGRYLRTTVRTGTYCAYEPDPRFPVTWEL